MAAPLSSGQTEQDIHFIVRVHQTHMTYQHLLAIWQAADSLGYDGASLYDLLAAPCLECWTTLTMLTMATHRIRAIPMVLSHTYRHPAVLAKMAATLDIMSGGRLVLGLGAGGSQRDHEASGIPWRPLQDRLVQLEEGIQLLRFLWSGQEGPFKSRFYGTVEGSGFPQPIQAGGPPILVGGHGERYVLRIVARVADLCNIGFDLSPVQWQRYKEILERVSCEEGRTPTAIRLTHNATVILGSSTEMIRTQVERYAQAQNLPVEAAKQRLAHALVGTPEQCVARLQAYVMLGIRTFFLGFQICQILIHSRFLRQRFFLLFAPGGLSKTTGTLLAPCSEGMNRDVLSCKELRLQQLDGRTIMICVICGGIGGARLARGISYVYDPAALTYICNVGDNIQFFGLSICPDIDAIIYYLSGSADFDRGWGLHDESFNLLDRLRLFSPDFWFGLGDKDMATHIWRSELLHNGASLSEVTARESQLGGIQARVIPATDTWVETWIETVAHAALHYEEYFIRYRCEPRVSRVRYVGIEDSRPSPGVLETIASASTILIAPSNPVASVLPIISVPGIQEALVSKREKIWAISPVIEALELPTGERIRARSRERLLAAFGLPHSPVSVGHLYKDFCSHFVLDERDFVCKSQLEEMGYDVHLLRTDALSLERQKDFARELLQITEGIAIAGVGSVSGEHTARG